VLCFIKPKAPDAL